MCKHNSFFVGRLGNSMKTIRPSSIRPRLIYEFEWKEQLCEHTTCQGTLITPLMELASLLNFSLIVGPLNVHTIRPYDEVLKLMKPSYFWMSSSTYLLSGEFKHFHEVGFLPIYCSGKHKLEAINIFVVPFQSLEARTWTVLLVAIACFYHYDRMTNTSSSKAESLFEIVEMLLQRTTRKRDLCRNGLLMGCFFIEFLYLTGSTESIIAPQRRRAPETILELFQTGHKWYQGAWKNIYSLEWITDYKTQMEQMLLPQLKHEGFEGNQFDLRKLWVEDIFEGDYLTSEVFDESVRMLLKYKDLVCLISSGKQNLEMERHKPLLRGRDETSGCYIVKKLYGKGVNVFYLYSSYRFILSPAFDRIWHDSGILLYWHNMNTPFRQKYSRLPVSPQTAQISLTDVRTVAIFGLLYIGLTFAVVCVSMENRTLILNWICIHVTGIKNYIKTYIDVIGEKFSIC